MSVTASTHDIKPTVTDDVTVAVTSSTPIPAGVLKEVEKRRQDLSVQFDSLDTSGRRELVKALSFQAVRATLEFSQAANASYGINLRSQVRYTRGLLWVAFPSFTQLLDIVAPSTNTKVSAETVFVEQQKFQGSIPAQVIGIDVHADVTRQMQALDMSQYFITFVTCPLDEENMACCVLQLDQKLLSSGSKLNMMLAEMEEEQRKEKAKGVIPAMTRTHKRREQRKREKMRGGLPSAAQVQAAADSNALQTQPTAAVPPCRAQRRANKKHEKKLARLAAAETPLVQDVSVTLDKVIQDNDNVVADVPPPSIF